MTRTKTEDKLYYSISEVATITDTEAYVLRYWEREFSLLKPKKNRGGNRIYVRKDIDLVNRIKFLRTKEKLTIAGTRDKLTMRKQGEQKLDSITPARVNTLIGQIKKEVQDLLKLFP